MNFYKKAMMAEGGEMPQYAEGGQMSEGAKQLQMLKAAYDKAVEEKNMEMIGKIETVIADMYEKLDDRGQEMISDMFPQMDFMARAEQEGPQEMAADGEGKMSYGGKIKEMMMGGYMNKKKDYPGGGYFHMK